MINEILQWLANGLIMLGAFFALTGAIGLLRMPDFFSRLHPAGVTDSLGIPFILLGLMIHAGLSLATGKLVLLLLFLLLTSPTACHALAKTAYLPEAVKRKQVKPEKIEPATKNKPKGSA